MVALDSSGQEWTGVDSSVQPPNNHLPATSVPLISLLHIPPVSSSPLAAPRNIKRKKKQVPDLLFTHQSVWLPFIAVAESDTGQMIYQM